jgi:hypothetical protein
MKPLSGLVQHFLGDVDSGDFDIPGQGRDSQAGSHPHFQQLSLWKELQILRGQFPALVKNLDTEYQVVEDGETIVEFLHVLNAHRSLLLLPAKAHFNIFTL